MIRLQFSTSTEWSSAVIRRMCHSPFSHVDVLDADGNCIGASDSPKAAVLRGNPNGVAVRPPDYQVFGVRHVAELSATPEVEKRFFDLIDSQLGKPFDDSALYAFLSPDVSTERDWREADAWFCSELAAWALEQSGFWPYTLLVAKNRVSPADLLLLVNPYASNIETFWLTA